MHHAQRECTVSAVTTTEGPVLGLRERKKVAARHALQRAALELATERGVEHVTVDDIAARAGMSPRTFFNYFSSKDDALVAPDARVLELMARQVIARPRDESPLEALRVVLLAQLSSDAAELDLLRLRMAVVEPNAALLPRLVGSFAAAERLFAGAVAARTGTDVDRDTYPTLLAAVAAAAMRTALHLWRTSNFTASLTDLLDEAFTSVAAGLPIPRPER
jgi:AcrR family transcriptional regulator